MPAKETTPRASNILGLTGMSGKSVTGVFAHQHGDMLVIAIAHSGGTTLIKASKGVVKVGGTTDWESGTVVLS